jgi:hypothetical protein
VELINRGNVHLHNLTVAAVTNSSTGGLRTVPALDCGLLMPTRLIVGTALTCSSALLFTTPVGSAGLQDVRAAQPTPRGPSTTDRVSCVVLGACAGDTLGQHDNPGDWQCHKPARTGAGPATGCDDADMRQPQHT